MALFLRPFVSRATSAPAYWVSDVFVKMLATGVQTQNRFALMEQEFPKGSTTHTRVIMQDQCFYVLCGQATFNTGSKHGSVVKTGDFICIPRHTEYSFVVDETNTRFLNFITPAGPEQVFLGVGHPAEKRQLPDHPMVASPREQYDTLCQQYGVKPIGGIVGSDAEPGQQDRLITKDTGANHLKPFITNEKSCQSYWAINERWTILASSEQTGGAYTFFPQLFPQGNVCPPLQYESRDEMYYILDGEATLLLGDRTEKVGKGDFVYVPRTNIFAIRVDSETMSTITIDVPAGQMEALLPVLATPTDEEGLPPPGLKPPVTDPSVMGAVFEQIGGHMMPIEDPLAKN